MKRLLFILVVFSSASCTSTSSEVENKRELISSTSWTLAESLAIEDGNLPSKYTFEDNGSYRLKAGEIEVIGEWKWVSKDEIHLQLNGLSFDGEATEFDQAKNQYNMRVLELNENVFKTLEKHIDDDWESTFVKEIIYKPFKQ